VRHMGTVLLELELEPREPDQTAGTSMRLAAIAPSAGIYTPVADASLIGEPAAARGRSATEGGDEPGRREDAALFGGTHRALTFFEPALDQQSRYRAPSPNIGTRVKRIAEHVAHQALRRNLPDQLGSLDGVGRQLYVMITEPLECLTHAPQFSKLHEYELNRFRDPSIGMQHNLTQRIKSIPNRDPFEQLPDV
jgi:hypothetical protein